MTVFMRQRETPPPAVGRRERNIYTEIHTEITSHIRQFILSPGLGLSVQYIGHIITITMLLEKKFSAIVKAGIFNEVIVV